MIAAELVAMLRSLEEFEAIRRRAVRLGSRLCDLSYPNPDNGLEAATRDVLRGALERDRRLDLQYSPFGGQTAARRAVADDLALRCRLAFTFDDVILTPGAMAALHLALRSLGNAGDEVVIPTPCWLDYPLYAVYLGLRPRLVPLTDGTFEIDPVAIENAITPRTCAVLLSHPSNPAGRNYTAVLLAALAAALERGQQRVGRSVTLIADEVHRDFVAPGTYRSLAEVWPATLIVYSFGKYHCLQGQRTGYLAVSPAHPQRAQLAADAVRWTRITGFCTPTSLMQVAIPDLLRLRHDLSHIARWRERMISRLGQAGYEVVPADATPFLYLATPGGRDDFEFIHDLACNGVLALPAPLFHHRGYFRLSLMGAAPRLEAGLTTLLRVRAQA